MDDTGAQKEAIPTEFESAVVRQNRQPAGDCYIMTVDGVTHRYYHDDSLERASRFAKIFDVDVGWIESFVSHAPTVGDQYEFLLRSLLREFLPENLSIGTGFVHDAKTRNSSHQLDVIVYCAMGASPLYRRDNFSIVVPSAVKAICEVKKTLKVADLTDIFRKTDGVNLGKGSNLPTGVQRMHVFALTSKASVTAIARRISRDLGEFLGKFGAGGGNKYHISNITIISVYIRDRDEFIEVSVKEVEHGRAKFRVGVFRTAGEAGISSMLGAINLSVGRKYHTRDLVSCELNEVVEEFDVPNEAYLISYFTNNELLDQFPDSAEILRRRTRGGNRPLGAFVNSFAALREHKSLQSLATERPFSWDLLPKDLDQG